MIPSKNYKVEHIFWKKKKVFCQIMTCRCWWYWLNKFLRLNCIHSYSNSCGYIFTILEGRETLNRCPLLSKYYVILFLKINLYKWNLTGAWLLSLSIIILRLCIHFCVSIFCLYCWWEINCMNMSLVDGHLDFFQFWAITNKAAINMHIHVCMWTYTFLSLKYWKDRLIG